MAKYAAKIHPNSKFPKKSGLSSIIHAPVGVPVVALLLTLRLGKPRDISISVVWSPFAAIYFIPIEDWIGRLYIVTI